MNAAIVCKRVASEPHALERNLATRFEAPIYSIQTQELSDTTITVREIPQTKPPVVGRFFDAFFDRLSYSFWKPPSEYDTIISSGLRTQPLVQWPEQRRVHYYHGIHRGAFGYPAQDSFADNSIIRGLQMLNRSFIRLMNENSFNFIDTLVANSRHTAEMIEHHYGESVDAIIPPTFIDVDSYGGSEGYDEDFYLYLGRLADAKGIETIVEAFAHLDETLVVAGEGRLHEDLCQQATENVRFEGYVSEQRKRELFRSCNGFIQNTYAEPFGITTIEAFASGVPVIAANVGNNQFLIEDGETGILFDRSHGGRSYQRASTPEPLIEAIERAAAQEWDSDHLQATAQSFDRSQTLSQWKELLYS